MREATIQMLAGGAVMHRLAILENLQTAGIMKDESNPIAHLAAFLSNHRHLFASDGRGNFSLRLAEDSEPHPAPIQEAGNEAGGETVANTASPVTEEHERNYSWAGSPATD